VDVFLGRARNELIAAVASHFRLKIIWMDSRFHSFHHPFLRIFFEEKRLFGIIRKAFVLSG